MHQKSGQNTISSFRQIKNHESLTKSQLVCSDYAKTRQQWALTFIGPQVAKKLDSWKDIVSVIIMEVIDSEVGFLPSQTLRERRRSYLDIDWFSMKVYTMSSRFDNVRIM